jgi:23S rRNA pseudouridine2605 synthase
MEERLQKILARAGFGSRRNCEEFLKQGRVVVNGKIAQLGQKADPEQDRITVDGRRIQVQQTFEYIALHKPVGVLSDTRGRDEETSPPTVLDLIPFQGHLYPVGRLDLRSEGLILLTNDGEMANVLTHPRYEHTKEYRVAVEGRPSSETLQQWRQGVVLDGKPTAPADISVINHKPNQTWLRVVLHEGRKRQIRRIAAQLGHPVRRLIRQRIGPIHLGNLKPGEWRQLSQGEIEQLHQIKEQKKLRKRTR